MKLLSSPADLPKVITGCKGLVVVNFFTEDCYSCKSLHPVSEAARDSACMHALSASIIS